MKKIYLLAFVSFVFFTSCKSIPNFAPQPNLLRGTNTLVAKFDVKNRNALRDIANKFVIQNYLIDYFSVEDMILQTKFKKESRFNDKSIAFQIQVSQNGRLIMKAYEKTPEKVTPISYEGKMNYVWKTMRKVIQKLDGQQIKFAKIN